MLIENSVYGKVEICEPVLIELIKSKPVIRMKKVLQSGVIYKVIPWKKITRYDHCVGAMILLRIKGASVEEQIAGLLHDIPHTAFSHAIDYVFKNENHDFHEKFQEIIIKNSEIPKILTKYRYSVERIMDENNFPLLEKSSPNLCADRIDYTLRELIAKTKDKKKIKKYLTHIVVKDNEFVFDDAKTALEFSVDFLEMIQSWASPLQLAIVETIALAIKKSLELKIITMDDLFTTDEEVLKKMRLSKNLDIIQLLDSITPKLNVIENEKDFDYESKEKLRFIDPKVIPENKRVSEIYPNYKELLEKHKTILSRGVHAKILNPKK